MKIEKQIFVGVIISLMFSTPLIAAEEQGVAEVRNGGVTTMLKNRDYELVARPDSLTVFVYQDEKPASTKGAMGTLTLSQGDYKTTVALQPSGANALEAKGAFKVGAGTKAVATITLSGRKPQEVPWTLK